MQLSQKLWSEPPFPNPFSRCKSRLDFSPEKEKMMKKGTHLGHVASLTEENKDAQGDPFYLYDL